MEVGQESKQRQEENSWEKIKNDQFPIARSIVFYLPSLGLGGGSSCWRCRSSCAQRGHVGRDRALAAQQVPRNAARGVHGLLRPRTVTATFRIPHFCRLLRHLQLPERGARGRYLRAGHKHAGAAGWKGLYLVRGVQRGHLPLCACRVRQAVAGTPPPPAAPPAAPLGVLTIVHSRRSSTPPRSAYASSTGVPTPTSRTSRPNSSRRAEPPPTPPRPAPPHRRTRAAP